MSATTYAYHDAETGGFGDEKAGNFEESNRRYVLEEWLRRTGYLQTQRDEAVAVFVVLFEDVGL